MVSNDEQCGDGTDGARRGPGGRRPRFTRRRVLAAGAASVVGVAGCSGGGDDGDGDGGATGTDGQDDGTTPGDGTTTTDGGESDDDGAWATYQRDDRNTGFSPGVTGPGEEPTVAWRGSSEHTDGPATVVDGVVYVGGPKSVYAYDAESGAEQWSYEVGDQVDAAVTVAGETVVFPSRAGKVHALSAADGEERWVRSEVDGAPIVAAGDLGIKQGSATVIDGTVYVSKDEDRRRTFHGLDLETGEVRFVVDGWPTDRQRDGFVTTPAIADGTAYLGARSGFVHAVDLDTAEVVWSSGESEGKSIFGSPAVVDGTVYVTNHAQGSGNKPVLSALDAASGDLRWSYDLGPEEHGSRSVGSVCVAHDAVFASNRNGVLHAVERSDGAERWTYDTGRRIYGAASADAERVYVGNDGGTVYALDPATGEVHWQFSGSSIHAVDAAPTPDEDRLYVTSDDRSVVALTEP